MKKTFVLSFSLIILLTHVVFAVPPLNLAEEKIAIENYYASHEFDKDVAKVLSPAYAYLQKRIEQNRHLKEPKKLAITLDIDETALTNFYVFKKRDFSNKPQDIFLGYQRNTSLPAIKPVLKLFKNAIAQGVHVFFISFRPRDYYNQTKSNLYKAGYKMWSKLFLPDKKEFTLSPDVYKAGIRKKLSEAGYAIVLNIGDQDTDLVGGYSERISKMPNPLYIAFPKDA